MLQALGNIGEMSDTDRQHNRTGSHGFTVIEPQQKPVRQAVDIDHELVFKLRHHAIPESESIRTEGFQSHWYAGIGILDALLRAKLSQRERILRVINV